MSPEEKLVQIGMRVSPLPPNRAAKLAAELEAIQRELERFAQKKGNGGADSLSDLDARIGPQPAPANGADYDGAQAPSADARGTRAETPHDKPLPKLVPIRFVEGEIPKPREWIVHDGWITTRKVTLLQGDGGDGKTAAGQQLL